MMLPTALDLRAELTFALSLADMADAISVARFRAHDLVVQTKSDLTPVTDADRAVETALREAIGQRRPSDQIVGEEFGGNLDAAAEWRWIIDPIDGTKAFARGLDSWATLIALQYQDQPVVAVASAPAAGARYHALAGEGAFRNHDRIHVSAVDSLEDAVLAHTSVSGFVRIGAKERLTVLAGRCWEATGLGNSLSHLVVARGGADIGWTSRAQPWDFAALALIVREAGGRFHDESRATPLGGMGLSANPRLFAMALEMAQGTSQPTS